MFVRPCRLYRGGHLFVHSRLEHGRHDDPERQLFVADRPAMRAWPPASWRRSRRRPAPLRAPLKKPGKQSELLIWFGKSLRPVAMTVSGLSSSANTSGSGLARANTTGRGAMSANNAGSTEPRSDVPMNRSAPLRADGQRRDPAGVGPGR